MKNEAPTFRVDHAKLLQAVAEASTNDHSRAWHAVACSLLMANMNSLPLDWAARQSAGGANMNFYIVKQLPVLPPLAYLQKPFPTAAPYIALVMPRILELTYTATEMSSYAKDLGYDGPPFTWDDDRRLALRCELDAIHAYLYHIDRGELAWILDAPPPGISFPALKGQEGERYGEYRTQQLVLEAYDRIAAGSL